MEKKPGYVVRITGFLKTSNELVDLRKKNNYKTQNISIKILCILIIAGGISLDIVTVENIKDTNNQNIDWAREQE